MSNYPNLLEVFFLVKPPQLLIVYRKLMSGFPVNTVMRPISFLMISKKLRLNERSSLLPLSRNWVEKIHRLANQGGDL